MPKRPHNKEYKRLYYLKNKDKMLAVQKQRYAANKEEWLLALKKRNIRKKFFPHLSVADAWSAYQQMILAQDNKCAFCGKPEKKVDQQRMKVTALAIDHYHVTGAVRGLLCFVCNTHLGWLDRLATPISAYLSKVPV